MQTAQSPEVKQYAQMLVQDHQKNDEQLQQIAQTMGVNLEGEKFQDKQKKAQEHLSDLREKQGAEFDKEFMSLMVKDHKKDVKEVEKAAKEARKQNHTSSPPSSRPTHTGLQGHLQEAKRIEKSLDTCRRTGADRVARGRAGHRQRRCRRDRPGQRRASGTTGAASGARRRRAGPVRRVTVPATRARRALAEAAAAQAARPQWAVAVAAATRSSARPA